MARRRSLIVLRGSAVSWDGAVTARGPVVLVIARPRLRVGNERSGHLECTPPQCPLPLAASGRKVGDSRHGLRGRAWGFRASPGRWRPIGPGLPRWWRCHVRACGAQRCDQTGRACGDMCCPARRGPFWGGGIIRRVGHCAESSSVSSGVRTASPLSRMAATSTPFSRA